jgi:predicted ABC-type ATPase
MARKKPSIIILAGPNDAGKSSAAPGLLRGKLRVTEFVNADVIARGLSAFEPEAVAITAGKMMLSRLRELAALHRSFAFETTLASRTFAPWIAGLMEEGFELHLIFLWLPSAEAAIDRVRARIRDGGHADDMLEDCTTFLGCINLFQHHGACTIIQSLNPNLSPKAQVRIQFEYKIKLFGFR